MNNVGEAPAPPLALLLVRALDATECSQLIALAEEREWRPATVLHGDPGIRTSTIQWVADGRWLRRVQAIGEQAAAALQVDVWPRSMATIQISRYAAGQSYGWHVDHDTERTVGSDRKVSIVISLSDNGCLELDHIGRMRLNLGDALAFASVLRHRRPAPASTQYSVAGWLPGPRWR